MTFNRGNNRAAKLNALLVLEIRRKYATGQYTQARLAREHKVSGGTIFNIVNELTWQNVPAAEANDQEIAMSAALKPVPFDEAASLARLDKLMNEANELRQKDQRSNDLLDELNKGDY